MFFYRQVTVLLYLCLIYGPVSAQTADTTQANQYYQRAELLSEQAKYQEANQLFRRAQHIYQKAAYWEKYIACLNSIAYNQWPVAAYDSATYMAERVLQLSERYLGSDHPEAARAYDILGIVQEYDGHLQNALDYYQRSLNIRKRNFSENHKEIADSYEHLGIIYELLGHIDQSLNYHLKVLAIRKTTYTKVHPLLADCYNNLGIIYEKKRAYDQALAYHQKALAIRNELFGSAHPDIAMSYSNLGTIYQLKGSYSQTLTYYQKALAVSKEVFEEVRPSIAMSYSNLGKIYELRGAYDQALAYHQKALAIENKLFGEIHPNIAINYNNLGVVYEKREAYDQALTYSQKALDIKHKLFGETHPEVESSYNILGIIYEKKRSYGQALTYHQKALAITKRFFGEIHPEVAMSYNNLGVTYELKRSYNQALLHYQKAIAILKNTFRGAHPYIAITYNSIGHVYFEQKDYSSALYYFQQSLIANGVSSCANDTCKDIENHLSSFELVHALKKRGDALLMMKRDSAAYSAYVLADSTFHRLQYSYQSQDDKVSARQAVKGLYEGVIHVALRLYKSTQDKRYLHRAFYFSERSKAAILMAALSTTKAIHSAQAPDYLVRLESSLKEDRSFYRTRLTSKDSTTARNKLLITNRRYDSLIDVLETKYPDYYQLKYATQSATVPGIQSQLSPNEAIVSYFMGDSSQYAFTITTDQLIATPLSTDSLLSQRIQSLGRGLHTDSTSHANYVQQASVLYHQLLAPIVEDSLLRGINRLTIIPNGALGYLPFDLLLTQPVPIDTDYHSLPYLMHNYTIRYGYSATWLFNPFSRSEKQVQNQYIAFAPSYQTTSLDSTHQLALGRFRSQVAPLRFNQQEATKIEKYLSGVSLIGQSAVERRFKEEANSYGILHLAMHALVDDQDPMYSRLVFSQDDTDTLEDGYLHAYELYNMDLPADLAVLSACETGYGKLERGEGIMSLARAFAYAGCPSIVMSHWTVDDAASAQLMDHFYRYLSEGLPKDEALRQAKLTYLENASVQEANPFFWGNFVVIGDVSPIVDAQSNRLYWWLGGGGLLLLIVLLLRRSFQPKPSAA